MGTPTIQHVVSRCRGTACPEDLHNAFRVGYKIQTANVDDVDGAKLIDHVATSESIQFLLERTIGRKDDDGKTVSDHPALIGNIVANR